MKFFLDSAKIDEIKYALDVWQIDGITTNPKHIQVAGKPFMTAIHEIAEIFKGTDKTVSVEINPHYATLDEMVTDAEKLAAISPNFVIKLPCIEPTFQAIPILAQKGIRVNTTLIFSPSQALQAMRVGAYYVSPFVGWKEANGEDVNNLIPEIVAIRDNYNFETEILAAATRNGRQIVEAALFGADIITAYHEIFQAAFDHPYTHNGIKIFQEFWDQTPYE
jgi:transaldolase